METKHTPTPWTVGMYGASADFRAIDIHAAVCKPDGSLLATCGPFDDESKADAAYIVRAVNAHNDLLISAKEALCWLDPDCKLDGETPNEDRSDKENLIIGLYEALAKAEGK